MRRAAPVPTVPQQAGTRRMGRRASDRQAEARGGGEAGEADRVGRRLLLDPRRPPLQRTAVATPIPYTHWAATPISYTHWLAYPCRGRPSGWTPSGPASRPGRVEPLRAARRALGRRMRRAGALPRGHFDHAALPLQRTARESPVLEPTWSKAAKWAALEAASSSTRGRGWAPTRPVSSLGAPS